MHYVLAFWSTDEYCDSIPECELPDFVMVPLTSGSWFQQHRRLHSNHPFIVTTRTTWRAILPARYFLLALAMHCAIFAHVSASRCSLQHAPTSWLPSYLSSVDLFGLVYPSSHLVRLKPSDYGAMTRLP
jgi:hypothetical protein